VIITGCTEGIGKGFCFPLAKIGFYLCLISINKTKLENLQEEIKSKYPMIKTRIIVVDFSSYSNEMYDQISEQLKDIDVSILVNNVGMAFMSKLIFI
jgi:17beta-estradiol 17-dehydrogenase / very-long-chain 3-oxoacyl-CoA reductase